VAEPAAVVTDTHPLLFHAAGGALLSKRAARVFTAAEERLTIVYVPVAVMWESSLLARAGRVELGRSVEEFFTDLFSNPAYQAFDLTPAQIYIADRERPNEDPFDALVCAAARSLDLPLVTRDGDIQESKLVKIVW
jgi:PIN domain nuclease of toxin-antitoxin system